MDIEINVGKEKEDRAEKESAVEIDGVTSDRGTEDPFTGACCRSTAISESRSTLLLRSIRTFIPTIMFKSVFAIDMILEHLQEKKGLL